MAFRLHCDRCLRMIQVVDAKTIKTLADTGKETVCKFCQKSEDQMISAVNSIKNQVAEKIRIIELDIRTQLIEEIQKIAEANRKEV